MYAFTPDDTGLVFSDGLALTRVSFGRKTRVKSKPGLAEGWRPNAPLHVSINPSTRSVLLSSSLREHRTLTYPGLARPSKFGSRRVYLLHPETSHTLVMDTQLSEEDEGEMPLGVKAEGEIWHVDLPRQATPTLDPIVLPGAPEGITQATQLAWSPSGAFAAISYTRASRLYGGHATNTKDGHLWWEAPLHLPSTWRLTLYAGQDAAHLLSWDRANTAWHLRIDPEGARTIASFPSVTDPAIGAAGVVHQTDPRTALLQHPDGSTETFALPDGLGRATWMVGRSRVVALAASGERLYDVTEGVWIDRGLPEEAQSVRAALLGMLDEFNVHARREGREAILQSLGCGTRSNPREFSVVVKLTPVEPGYKGPDPMCDRLKGLLRELDVPGWSRWSVWVD